MAKRNSNADQLVLLRLPDDVICQILSHLRVEGMVRAMQTCRSLQRQMQQGSAKQGTSQSQGPAALKIARSRARMRSRHKHEQPDGQECNLKLDLMFLRWHEQYSVKLYHVCLCEVVKGYLYMSGIHGTPVKTVWSECAWRLGKYQFNAALKVLRSPHIYYEEYTTPQGDNRSIHQWSDEDILRYFQYIDQIHKEHKPSFEELVKELRFGQALEAWAIADNQYIGNLAGDALQFEMYDAFELINIPKLPPSTIMMTNESVTQPFLQSPLQHIIQLLEDDGVHTCNEIESHYSTLKYLLELSKASEFEEFDEALQALEASPYASRGLRVHQLLQEARQKEANEC
jgi:hypothetical protein